MIAVICLNLRLSVVNNKIEIILVPIHPFTSQPSVRTTPCCPACAGECGWVLPVEPVGVKIYNLCDSAPQRTRSQTTESFAFLAPFAVKL